MEKRQFLIPDFPSLEFRLPPRELQRVLVAGFIYWLATLTPIMPTNSLNPQTIGNLNEMSQALKSTTDTPLHAREAVNQILDGKKKADLIKDFQH